MLIITMIAEGQIFSRDELVEALIERMSFGDMSAVGELYELIEPDVFAYALSKTANKADAEDIVQDTFVHVWKNAAQYKPMGKPLAWIFTIEINLIRRQFNNNKKIIQYDESIDAESHDENFAESFINNELLRQILKTLSEEEREIISLHIVSGLKHREIAKLLNKPLSTVLSRYNRAIKKLQMQISDKEGCK